MEIIIKGDPKEIAALELALNDGKNVTNVINNYVSKGILEKPIDAGPQ